MPIFAHNVKDPNSAEYLSKVFGTRTIEKITKQYDTKNKKSSKGSIREVEEYIVHPNDLKKLKVGQSYCKIILLTKLLLKNTKKIPRMLLVMKMKFLANL